MHTCTVHFEKCLKMERKVGFSLRQTQTSTMGSQSRGNEKPRGKGFSAHLGQRAPSVVFLDLGYGSTSRPGTIAPLSWHLGYVASKNGMRVPYSSLPPLLGLMGRRMHVTGEWTFPWATTAIHQSNVHYDWKCSLSALFPRKPSLLGSVVFTLHAVNSASQGIHEILKWRFQWKFELYTQPPQRSRSFSTG